MPEPGRLKGLSLILDAHSDLVGSSSVPDDFQVYIYSIFRVWFMQGYSFLLSGLFCSHRLKESIPFDDQEKLSDPTWPHGFLC